MSLSTKIAAAVESHPGLPCAVAATDDAGHALALTLTAAGPVGLAFDGLEFTAAGRAPRTPEALRAWADRVAARVTYLREPLVVLEQDREANELEMRSKAPTVRQGKRTFYEVRLKGDGVLTLSRVAFDEATRRREAVPCQMTSETLEHLADDLVATAG